MNLKLTVPFYLHKAGAGFPSPATDYIEEDIDLNVHLIKNVPATFIIRVQGKSMTNIGINDGDLLVIDKSLNPKNFSTVIANVHDELVVKSFVQEKDKKFLTSGSKKFEEVFTEWLRSKKILVRSTASANRYDEDEMEEKIDNLIKEVNELFSSSYV